MSKELSTMQLSLAKRQWKGQIGISSEINENSALNMAKNYLHYDKYITMDDVFAKIDAISGKQILDVANELFSTGSIDVIYV